jgi:Na+-driven multidrug efflux pump
MSKTPSYKSILSLAIPAVFGGIVEPVLSLTDIAVVGNISSIGSNESLTSLAAVGLAGSLISALLWIFAQVKSAISAIVSKAYGAKNLNSIATLIPQMILFNVLLGIFAFLLTYFSSSFIFTEILSASKSISKQAVSYYDIRAFGFPITLVTFSLFGVFRGVQNTYWAMVISIIGGLLNIVLDFVLVLGWGNLVNPMGIEGAAIASLIAQITMLCLTIYFLFRSRLKLYFSLRLNIHFKKMVQMAVNLMVRTRNLKPCLGA